MGTSSKREAARKVIREMKVGKWMKLEELARKARTGGYRLLTVEMAGFLRIAKAKGFMQHRGRMESVKGRPIYVSEWRKTRNVSI